MNDYFFRKAPPLGVMPRWLHDENRASDLASAILRCMQAGWEINPEWVQEYNEIIQRAKKEGRTVCLNSKIL